MEIYQIILLALAGILLLFILLYLFAVGTKRSREIKKYSNVKFAHRGLHAEGVAENSLTAFRLAAERGFGIELDIRLSKDKKLVVFHDDTLDRVCMVSGRVCEYTAEELGSFRLSGTSDTVPLFSEVLSLVGGRVPLLVEIKEDRGDSEVSRAAAECLAEYGGEYMIESFNPLSLRNVKRLLPRAERGILSKNYFKSREYRKPMFFLLGSLLTNFLCRPSFVAYDHRHYRSFGLKVTRRLFGAVSFAWTVRSEKEEREAIEHGFDSVIFEGYIPK